jgi:dienelactone hydrolase
MLLGHGGGHSKDAVRFVNLSRHYAEQTSLAVVCIDAVDHGERKAGAAALGLPRSWHSNAMDQMVDDWCRTAAGLTAIGPALAYVGFSMGAIFGIPTVAAMPSITAAVLVVGGIPSGGIDDPRLGPVLLDAAAHLEHAEVLMLNKSDDEIFPAEGTQALFDALPGTNNQLMFWEGKHDDWPPDLIRESVTFINQHVPR